MPKASADDEYEAQRLANVEANKKLLMELGLTNFNETDELKVIQKEKRLYTPLANRIPQSDRSLRIRPPKQNYNEFLRPKRGKRNGSNDRFEPRIRIDGRPDRSCRRTKRYTEEEDDDDEDLESETEDDLSLQTPIDTPSGSISPGLQTKRQRLNNYNGGDEMEESEEADEGDDENSANLSKNLKRKGEKVKARKFNPKTFGEIPGISVGTHWPTRVACSGDSIHSPVVAGIAGEAEKGCYSIALSGGYEDDIDNGDWFMYTGSGGRKLSGIVNGKKVNLRTAPQTFDQTFEHSFNASILKSYQTRNPVRVVRGYKCQSIWSPNSGYVYCGLYQCTEAFIETGQSGFKVTRFRFDRLPGQASLLTFNRTGITQEVVNDETIDDLQGEDENFIETSNVEEDDTKKPIKSEIKIENDPSVKIEDELQKVKVEVS